MHDALTALPTYDLGPGRGQDELIVNLVIYGGLAALLLTALWIMRLSLRAAREPQTVPEPTLSRSPDTRRDAFSGAALTYDHWMDLRYQDD
jgi:hypothetical protein